MDEFLHSIKRKYKDRLINREKQWPPCHSNKLIRLELVEREKGEKVVDNIQRGSLERRERKARFDHDTIHKGNEKKTVKRTPLVYDDMFEMKSGKRPVRKILVEGDAGIGKTTLSVSISEDWSREMLFKEFELVLLLPLRHKKVASACSLPELLKLLHPSADVCKSVASYIEEEEAEKVLVIADGWDELSESKRQEGSFLYELLFETFPLMSVVVTSQPSASAPLHRLPCIDRFVVINGFGKDGIEEYVHCEFSSEHEKACRLLEQLKDNPLVESVCSVPLSCAIVCHLWRTSEEALPSTMTQLYTKIILNVILRNIRKKDSFKNVLSLPNFKSLPKELQQSFSLLCEFAFKALKENRIAYSQDELSEFFPQGSALDENILCFGLLQSAETVLETGRRVSFHFLHLTLMEYLAALHLSEQPKSTLLVVFSRKLDDPFATSRFNIVLRFFFGISFSSLIVEKKDTCIAVKAIEYVATSCFNPSLTLCHCVFESQNDVIIHEATQYVQKPLFTDVCSIGEIQTAHDFSATLAVLARIEELNCMKLIFSHCGIGTTQIIQLTDVLASKCGKVQVRCLNLSGNILTGECVSYLFLRASAAFKPDKKDNNQSDIKFNSQAISRSVGLSYLDISDILFRACDLLELENVVRNKVFSNLNHLNLKGCLTGDADINVKSLTTFLEALSTNCPRMVELNLSSNKLGVPGASAVARGVSRFQKYLDVSTYYDSFRLHFDDNNLGDEGFKAFVDNLDGMYNFSYLSLSGNSIHAAGVSYLAEAVCSRGIVMNKYVNRVDLSDNPLRIEGNKHINRMLSSSHCQFQKIDLCRCELAVTGSGISNTDSVSRGRSISIESAVIDIGQQICLMPINRTITRLKLDGNCFTSDGVHILISIMQHCICLQKLSCTNCGITSDDIVLLLRNISHFKITSPELCSRLVSWKLDNNQICNRGGTALIDHLPSIFKGYLSDFGYSVISLEDNPVDRDVRTKLNEELNLICKKVSQYII